MDEVNQQKQSRDQVVSVLECLGEDFMSCLFLLSWFLPFGGSPSRPGSLISTKLLPLKGIGFNTRGHGRGFHHEEGADGVLVEVIVGVENGISGI